MSIQLDTTYDILNKSKHILMRADFFGYFCVLSDEQKQLICIFQLSFLLFNSGETGAVSLSTTLTVDQSESTQPEFVKLSVWLAAKLGFPNH